MGELIGLPEWLAATIFVVSIVLIMFAVAWRNTKRQIRRTLVKRPNPTEDEFLRMMVPDVSEGSAKFLWDTALPYLHCHKPALTLHPEDHLLHDLPIDEDDWSMDWPCEFAQQQRLGEGTLPSWPDDWQATIRNYGRWLDLYAKAASTSEAE